MDLNKLIKVVSKHFDIDILAKTRKREYVMARGAYFWLAREYGKYTLKSIGDSANLDHASVLHALKNFDSWIRFDKQFEIKFKSLKFVVLTSFKNAQENNITYKNAEEFVYKINCLIIENDILKEKIKVLEKNRI